MAWHPYQAKNMPLPIQRYTYTVLHTIQMKLILLCVWAEPAVLSSAKTALKFIYKIQIGYYLYTIQCMGQFISFKSEINNPWFNPWFILLHTHLNVCATVEGRCLEYLVCITLVPTQKFGISMKKSFIGHPLSVAVSNHSWKHLCRLINNVIFVPWQWKHYKMGLTQYKGALRSL